MNKATFTLEQFILGDLPQTLFPLKTDRFLVEHGLPQLLDLAQRTANDPSVPRSFLPQTRVSAMKKGWHIRRTLKLDPLAEVFIYDLVYRNRKLFKKPHVPNRTHFGYRFENGRPLSSAQCFRQFQAESAQNSKVYDHVAKFDISSYFNNIYHHDMVQWLDERDGDERDVLAFGKFLREINSGRSTDFFPQGIYPCKMIGSDFLRFVENSGSLKSECILRFMDDFLVFSDSDETIRSDFLKAQDLIGLKGLYVNPAKTSLGEVKKDRMSTMKSKLLNLRIKVLLASGMDESEADVEEVEIEKAEVDYLKSMLESEHIEEGDAELVLTVMRHHVDDVSEYLESILARFPNLSKSFFYFAQHIDDREFLTELLLTSLKRDVIPEYQLFWMAAIAEEFLTKTKRYGDLLLGLLDHKCASTISKAKILEIPEKRFGLTEVREEILRSGQSNWLAWSSAVGAQSLKTSARNYLLGYFQNGSEMNRLIGDIVKNS